MTNSCGFAKRQPSRAAAGILQTTTLDRAILLNLEFTTGSFKTFSGANSTSS
jgi:hypothetical protein